jgi:hypothetical protein
MATEDEFRELQNRVRLLENENIKLQAEITGLEKDLKGLQSGIGRGLWLLGGGFIAAFVSWIAKGGMFDK